MKKVFFKKIAIVAMIISAASYIGLTISLNLSLEKEDYFAKATSNGAPIDPSIEKMIQNGSDEFIDYYINQANTRLTKKDPYALYDIQINTNNLLDYAGYSKNYAIVDKLGQLYLVTHQYLETDSGHLKWICGTSSCLAWDIGYANQEVVLASSQYVFVLADYLNIVSNIEADKRTANMIEMVTKFKPVVEDHLNRWALGSDDEKAFKAWANCTTGVNSIYRNITYNHQELLAKKIDQAQELGSGYSYCYSVTDSDIWIASAAAKIMSADFRGDTIFSIDAESKAKYKAYLEVAVSLFENRTTFGVIDDPKAGTVPATNFDLGVWDDYPDYNYAGYTEAAYPGISDTQPVALPIQPADNVGWDLSHGRRFVNAFDALYEVKSSIGTTFPSDQIMKGLANQLVYKVYNQDSSKPLFSNYLDGTNGWYRVNYSNRVGFGYAPYGSSISALNGGYGFWSRYNGEVSNILNNIWQKIESVMINDSSTESNLGLNNGVIFQPGKNDNSVYFDGGATSYVEPIRRQSFSSSKTTIEFWMKPSQSGNMDLIDLTQDGYKNFIVIRKTINNSILVYGEENDVAKISLTSQPINNPTEWHHIALTQDGTGVKIYIDGVLDTAPTGTNTTTWTENFKINNVWIGKGHWSNYQGEIDDFKLYNRALSSDEIGSEVAGASVSEDNLKINWNFNQSPDQEVSDFLKNNYNVNINDLLNFLPSIALNLSVKDDVIVSPEKRFIYPGGTMRYNITYKNNSGGIITNFKIENPIPNGASYVENSATDGARFENGKLVWERASLLPDQTFTASFSLRMNY